MSNARYFLLTQREKITPRQTPRAGLLIRGGGASYCVEFSPQCPFAETKRGRNILHNVVVNER